MLCLLYIWFRAVGTGLTTRMALNLIVGLFARVLWMQTLVINIFQQPTGHFKRFALLDMGTFLQ